MHISVSKLTNISSDNGLSPGRHQTIIGTSVGILLTKLQWNSDRNSYIFIQENAFENIVWVMANILPRINDTFREQHPQHHKFVNTLLIVQLLKNKLCSEHLINSWAPGRFEI